MNLSDTTHLATVYTMFMPLLISWIYKTIRIIYLCVYRILSIGLLTSYNMLRHCGGSLRVCAFALHKPIEPQPFLITYYAFAKSGKWSQRYTKVNESCHVDNPLFYL